MAWLRCAAACDVVAVRAATRLRRLHCDVDVVCAAECLRNAGYIQSEIRVRATTLCSVIDSPLCLT